MSDSWAWIWGAILVIFFVVGSIIFIGNWKDCSDQGSKYVRGAFTYECVGKEKP